MSVTVTRINKKRSDLWTAPNDRGF